MEDKHHIIDEIHIGCGYAKETLGLFFYHKQTTQIDGIKLTLNTLTARSITNENNDLEYIGQ